MANVVSLNGGPSGVPEVNENVVALLEDMLERARSGAVLGMTVAWVNHEAASSYCVAGRIGSYSLLGAVEMSRVDLANAMRELG